MKGALLVNHPLDFGGLRFYQSSYGRLPGGRQTLSWTQGGKPAGGREIHPGDHFALPGGAVKVEVLRFEGDLMRMGPAAKISVKDGKRTLQFWVFERIRQIQAANPGILAQVPMMNPGLFSPWLFSLEQTGERYFTVLLASRDPGTPLVAMGAGLVLAGLIVVFFFSHRCFWIRVESYDGGSRIVVAGQSNRDHAGLETEMQRLLAAGNATEERA
jgi:cytochrome c biogenesis protein